MAVATLSTGMVGGSMGFSLWDCFAIIPVVNIASCLLPPWTASFGLTGLRMTTFSRYSFGDWGNLLVVIFSMVSTTGWNAINSISGAMDYLRPRYLMDPPPRCLPLDLAIRRLSPTGPNGAAAALSFMAVVFSFAVSWINCAADYNVKMPANTPRYKIFWATYAGIFVPTVLVQTLGAALYSGVQANAAWKHVYLAYGVGGPLKMALEPAGGFGNSLMVLAALSSIPNNIPNNYSFAMHAQNFGPWALRTPRVILVTFGFVAAVMVGCCAARFSRKPRSKHS
ncbi:hypothetical protein BGZ57DRAFT_926653 [Hyaloscypha finlandica]|nr:hypothetical protein BGZ57DRAFT_926653 [Hyaloscypha finlandica]